MKNNFINFISILFLIFLLPSFVIGVAYVNYLIFLFLIVNISINFGKLKFAFFETKNFSILFLTFYFFLLLSSLLSNYVIHSLKSSLLYFVLIIYLYSLMNLFKKKEFEIFFLKIGLIFFFIICLDALVELFLGSNLFGSYSIKGRISGLFGDRWVIGSYLVRILPVLFGIFILNFYSINKTVRNIFIFIFLLSMFIIVFSGERTAFLLLILFLTFQLIFIKKFLSLNKVFVILIFVFLLFAFPFFSPDTNHRIIDKIAFYLTTFDFETNQYLTLYTTAIKMFLSDPLIGVGPNNFRLSCSEYGIKISDFSCSTHPHNIPLQLLAETGLVGFTFVYILFFYLIYNGYKLLKNKTFNLNHLANFTFISGSILNFWPLLPSGNFFLSWNSFLFILPLTFYFINRDKI